MVHYRNKLYFAAFILLLQVLQACATNPDNTQSKNAPAAAEMVKQPASATPGLKPKERFSKALRLLANGKVADSKAELLAFVAAVPKSRSRHARGLLEQINTPINAYFPSEFFLVTLGDGESLSTLAKTYLGDALMFYALARYNAIDAPSRVNVGQAIRIPLTESARLARANPNVIESEQSEREIDTELAEALIPETPANFQENVPSLEALLTAGNFASAVEWINTAPANSVSSDDAIKSYLGYAESSKKSNIYIAADAYEHLAELYQQAGQVEAAMDVLNTALALNPDHVHAYERREKLRQQLVVEYYRSASVAFRRQDLDSTIEYSDKVLAIDPEHSNAQLYRAQAIELKERLAKLKK